MKAYKNIIVPTDGSVNSKRALEHAVVLASSWVRPLRWCTWPISYP